MNGKKAFKKVVKEALLEIIKEENEYQEFFQKALDILGIDSPNDLTDDQQGKFFGYINAKWDKEESEPRSEIEASELEELLPDVMKETKQQKDYYTEERVRSLVRRAIVNELRK